MMEWRWAMIGPGLMQIVTEKLLDWKSQEEYKKKSSA